MAEKLKEFGTRSLHNLLQNLGHTPEKIGLDLLLGAEKVTPLTVAKMYSYLITMTPPPKRSVFFKQATPPPFHKKSVRQDNPLLIKFQPFDTSLPFKNNKSYGSHPDDGINLIKKLFQSSDCTVSFSSITDSSDDYWSIYLSKNTVTVIWLGSERGRIKLPELDTEQQRIYENLGHTLTESLCSETYQKNQSLTSPPVAVNDYGLQTKYRLSL